MVILPDELALLRDVQPLDRDVFYYLAERMDYKTGLIGRPRGVSYGGIAFDLSEHNKQGRRADSLRVLSLDDVRNSVRRLIKLGLIESQSEKGKGNDLILTRVFYGALINGDYCDQNSVTRKLPANLRHEISILHRLFNKLEEKEKVSYRGSYREVAITSFTQQHQQGDKKFLMFLDWAPTAAEYEMIFIRAGKKKEAVKPEWIAEFIAFWSAEGNRRLSQREWTARLAMHMIDYLRDPALYDRLRGSMPAEKKSAAPSGRGRPDWACIPQDDNALQAWAVQHGYCQAEPGWSFLQYRNVLRSKIENRLSEWRKLS